MTTHIRTVVPPGYHNDWGKPIVWLNSLQGFVVAAAAADNTYWGIVVDERGLPVPDSGSNFRAECTTAVVGRYDPEAHRITLAAGDAYERASDAQRIGQPLTFDRLFQLGVRTFERDARLPANMADALGLSRIVARAVVAAAINTRLVDRHTSAATELTGMLWVHAEGWNRDIAATR